MSTANDSMTTKLQEIAQKAEAEMRADELSLNLDDMRRATEWASEFMQDTPTLLRAAINAEKHKNAGSRI